MQTLSVNVSNANASSRRPAATKSSKNADAPFVKSNVAIESVCVTPKTDKVAKGKNDVRMLVSW